MHLEELLSKDLVADGYPTKVETLERGNYPGAWDLDDTPSLTDTFVGKSCFYVPTIYCSLSALERDNFDSYFSGESVTTGVNVITKDKSSRLEVIVSTIARVVTPLVNVSDRNQSPSP